MLWNTLATQADADALLEKFDGFHGGCLREAHVRTGHWVREDLSMMVDSATSVRLLIQRQFRPLSAIELLFEQVTRFNLVPAPENRDAIILDAALSVRDGLVCWAATREWRADGAHRDDRTWLAAR